MIFQGSKIYQFIMEAGEFVLYKQKLHCGYWVFLSRYSKWSYDFLMPKESSSLMIYLPNKTLVLGNRVLQWTYTDLFINELRYWGYLYYDSWLISRVAKKCIWNEWADANPELYLCTFFLTSIGILQFSWVAPTKANLLYWQSLTFHFVVGHYGPDHLLSIHYRSIMNIIGKKSVSLKFLPF